MHNFQINILTSNILMSYTCLNPRAHLQEEGCIYSYGTVRGTCINISSLVGRNGNERDNWGDLGVDGWILGGGMCV